MNQEELTRKMGGIMGRAMVEKQDKDFARMRSLLTIPAVKLTLRQRLRVLLGKPVQVIVEAEGVIHNVYVEIG